MLEDSLHIQYRSDLDRLARHQNELIEVVCLVYDLSLNCGESTAAVCHILQLAAAAEEVGKKRRRMKFSLLIRAGCWTGS